jgi:hypothetical protein
MMRLPARCAPEAANRVTTFVSRAGASQAVVTEGVAALSVWANPSPLDRVDGAYLGMELPRRDLLPASPDRKRAIRKQP